MPRIENTGDNVQVWYDNQIDTEGEGTSTHDVCRHCAQDLESDPHCYDESLTPYNGDPAGDGGWVPGVDHPPYEECEYECEVCGCDLTDEDD